MMNRSSTGVSGRKPAELTLSDGTDSIVIRPRNVHGESPILCKSWDLGSPEVRYTSVPNPGADGVTESPGFLGARTVVLELQILGDVTPDGKTTHDAYWYATKLTKMTHPAASPTLTITRKDELTFDKPWTMRLRGNPYSIVYGPRAAAILELQLSFTCPSGLIDGPLLEYSAAGTSGSDNITDWVFPAAFPKTFGLSGATYPLLVINVGGEAAVSPVIYISGPCVNPEIRTAHVLPDGTTETAKFSFDGLTLDAGETVQIDMGTGDIRLGHTGSGQIFDDMSAYGAVDWAVSTYWTWAPGNHTLTFLSLTGAVTVQFSERRFTI